MDSILQLPWTPIYKQETCELPTSSDDIMGYYALAFTVLFTVLVFGFEALIDVRQRVANQITEFPKQLETVVNKIDADRSSVKKKDGADKKDDETLLSQLQAKFEKAQLYGTDKIMFSIVSSIYDTIETVWFLMLGFLPYAWDMAVDIGKSRMPFGKTVESEIGITMIFLLLVQVIGMCTSFPFEVYSTFHIEKKHGFNKQTFRLFVTDKVKSTILSFVIGGPFIALLLYIIKNSGPYFYIYVWAFMFAFSVIMMTLVPVFIMPLFNKYEPLPDGVLKDRIFALAKQINYPLNKLFVMDGSKRSSHSNAFMFGFGSNKRIVLFDTLIEQVTEDEILAILGHELGHWKLGHTLTNFAVTQCYFGAAFYCFSLCYNSTDLYSAFGFDGASTPAIIALLLFFQTLWAPVDKVLSFILTVFSRECEFGADRFSADLGMSACLQSGLCKIHLENLGSMCPDWLYSTYHYSHPPLVERLSAMMEMEKKSK